MKIHRTNLNLPADLYADLKEETLGSPGGTVTGEIIARLRASLKPIKADDVVRPVKSVRTLIDRAGKAVQFEINTADGAFRFSVPVESFAGVAAQMMADAKMIEKAGK